MLFATLALVAAQPMPEPTAVDEITVVANKLRKWRGNWKLSGDAITCKTKGSTGDKGIDAIGCDALVACITPLAPRLAEIKRAKAPNKELSRRANALMTEAGVYDCIFAKREAAIAAFVAARRSKQS